MVSESHSRHTTQRPIPVPTLPPAAAKTALSAPWCASSMQTPYRSLPRKRESSFTPLHLLFRQNHSILPEPDYGALLRGNIISRCCYSVFGVDSPYQNGPSPQIIVFWGPPLRPRSAPVGGPGRPEQNEQESELTFPPRPGGGRRPGRSSGREVFQRLIAGETNSGCMEPEEIELRNPRYSGILHIDRTG